MAQGMAMGSYVLGISRAAFILFVCQGTSLNLTWKFSSFLSVSKQGGNHGTEVGVHHCLGMWGVYLYLRFYVRFFRCCSWFYSPTQILFIEELGDVVNFFSYICKCRPFFPMLLIMDVARSFYILFLDVLFYCFCYVVIKFLKSDT